MGYKKTILAILAFIVHSFSLYAQIAPNTYWVNFTDKNNSIYSIDKPAEFLSEKAINRRIKHNIAITVEDLPVNQTYVDSLRKLGLEIHNISKWFNGVAVVTTDTDLIDTLHYLSFIETPTTLKKLSTSNNKQYNKFQKETFSISTTDASTQLEMLKVPYLHTENINGKGVLIGILDSGFKNAKSIESLYHVWANNKVVATKDFVKDSTDMFEAHYHGTLVFSILAANWTDNLIGVAPEANYVLVRTENSTNEYLIEEYNWITGAEFADSIGVDIINSSLGYSTFDDANQNHTYEDLDGQTTPITKAANIAARKGILVVTSAGNSGDDDWFYITAPADADSVLTVGAVDEYGYITDFSSRGPTADGRIKPNVCAMGYNTLGQINNGELLLCNGTSCSSPLIAGLAACLLQSNPKASAEQLRQVIIESAHLYTNPNNILGFGIPNAIEAKASILALELTNIKAFPNPTNDVLTVKIDLPWLNKTTIAYIELFDLNGRCLSLSNNKIFPEMNTLTIPETKRLEVGYYFIKITVDGRAYQLPFLKLP